MRRVAAVLLALVGLLGLVSPPPAAADGPLGDGIQLSCNVQFGGAPFLASKIAGTRDPCDAVGDAVEKKVKEQFKKVWDSVLGDFIKSGRDGVRWILENTLFLALAGPSLDLEKTGLFGSGKRTSLAGMLVWLGLLISVVGVMWQLGKTAVTGQMKHLGRAMAGWGQQVLLSICGVGLVALLLTIGDGITSGIVMKTFGESSMAMDRIVAVMMPMAIVNPFLVLGAVAFLALLGLLQMAIIFLRMSAIPIQCLLLPIAGAGLVGGDATRKWTARLVTSIIVVIVYKPILAIIICAGFAEFGESGSLTEWLRGAATLCLGLIAPAPLFALFAPLGAEIGAGLSAGGALGAVANIKDLFGGGSDKGGGGDGGASPADAMSQARALEQQLPYGQGQGNTGTEDGPGKPDGRSEATDQAARTDKDPSGTSGTGASDTPGADTSTASGTGSAGDTGTAGASTGAKTGAGTAAGGPAGVTVQVLDGLSEIAEQAGKTMGGDK